MDMKGRCSFITKSRSLFKLYKSSLIRPYLQGVHLMEEDGIYKVIKGKYSWYIPLNNRRQAEWVLNFMSTHERYLDSLQTGDIVIEVGATTGEYTIPAPKKSRREWTNTCF